jgi:predicted MPP superfamily phosphohydrolase
MAEHPYRTASAVTLLFVLVTLVNFYVFDRITEMLGISVLWVSVVYALLLSTLLAVGFTVRASAVKGFKVLFVTVTTIYGLEVMALFALIALWIVDFIIDLPELFMGYTVVLFVLIMATVSAVNALTVSVKTIRLRFPEKVRAVHLSDLHIGAVHGKSYLAKVVEKVNGLEPDVVLITGDMTSGAPLEDDLFEGLGRLKGPSFMVTGNHEYYEGVEVIEGMLEGTGVRLLRDEKADMGGYTIFGLDYTGEQGISGSRDIEVQGDRPVILLTHVPQMVKLPKGSLILAGHYHAGQVFPLNFLGHLFLKYFRGIYVENGVTIHVSPGTATWGPPMRFGSRNEITLLELG